MNTAEITGGLHKAAALLTTLGQEVSAHILKQLTEEEIQRVSQAVAELQNLSSASAESVLEEYQQMLVAQQYSQKRRR